MGKIVYILFVIWPLLRRCGAKDTLKDTVYPKKKKKQSNPVGDFCFSISIATQETHSTSSNSSKRAF